MMPKSKNKTSHMALELGELRGEQDILLLGTLALVDAGDSLARNLQPRYPAPKEEYAFKDIIGVGYRCHYLAEEIEACNPQEDMLGFYERGVGSVYLENEKFFLKRETPIVTGTRNGREQPCGSSDKPFDFPNLECEDCYLRISSYIPKSYFEAFHSPHSILASKDPFSPYAVELDEACVLGRLNNEVQSIDMDELSSMNGFSSAVSDSLASSQKQLNMKARHIILQRKNAKVAASSLQALPVYNDTTKPPPQQGMIIYNADSECLECFDGTKWRTLVWKDEDESTP